jgi:hypothetical protein
MTRDANRAAELPPALRQKYEPSIFEYFNTQDQFSGFF